MRRKISKTKHQNRANRNNKDNSKRITRITGITHSATRRIIPIKPDVYAKNRHFHAMQKSK
ncbi:MAG: hypothetical protein FWG65_05805 [Turicibacter sp.]|nr:hypothetical protein [Turicibacter sp.]